MTYRSIIVPLNSYLHLQMVGRKQCRPDEPISEKWIERLTRNFKFCFPSGKKDLCSGDLGGKEGGRYTYWTVEQMAALLDEAGLPYTWGTCERICP